MRDLVLYGDPVLRKIAEPVTSFDDELRELVDDMFQIMYAEDGIGLAGPQAGDSRRVFVIDIPADDGEDGVRLVMVNPEIEHVGRKVTAEEGCLSIPGIRENVERPEGVRVRFRDAAGEPHELEAKGLLSRAIQHENDHLDGVLFVDRLPSMRRALLKRALADIAAGKVPRESERSDT